MMQSLEPTPKGTNQKSRQKILKRLAVRMMLSYIGMTVAFVLLLEILFSTFAFVVLSNFAIWDGSKFDAARQITQVYALEAATQAGAEGLNPHSTFRPGQSASLDLTIENASQTITYTTITPTAPQTVDYALLIDLHGGIVASSYPARYPVTASAAHLVPQQMPLIRDALRGKSGTATYALSRGRIICGVRPVWNAEKRVIGVIYVAIPSIFAPGEFLSYFVKGLFGTGLFLFIVLAPVGGFFGVLTMRGLVRRIHRLVIATANFAAGDYSQRVQLTRQDEIGQLELQFNQMAEQLTENTAQKQKLGEQNARLEERASIARDLHDNIKQQIFAVSMQLSAALALLDQKREEARQHLVEADDLVYQVRQELTLLVRELRPSVLQEKGLSSALKEYIAAWSRQNSITAELQIADTCNLPLAVEDALLRIAQEALSNIARHSGATAVVVRLVCEQKQVTLSLTDNGQGFDATQKNSAGVGLHSMRERMEALGGTLQVDSKVGTGTSIVAQCAVYTQQSMSGSKK